MPLSELRILEIRSFPHFSPTSFDIESWNFAYDFVLLSFRSSSTPVTLRQFFIRPSSDGTYYGMVMSVRPSVRHSFPHFSPTCFDILIWNFVYHFIFMHVRSSSNAINFRHFLQELCSFLTSNSFKYAVFRIFLLHALIYWVQILYMTLFLCTTEQVWVSSFCFSFCMSYASLWTKNTRNTQFSALFSYMLLHIELKFRIWLCYTPVFRRDVLWYGDVRPSGSPSESPSVHPTLRPSVRLSVRPGLRPPVFRTFLIHALTYWAEILHMTLF